MIIVTLHAEQVRRTILLSYLPDDKATSFKAISKLSPSTQENDRFTQPETIIIIIIITIRKIIITTTIIFSAPILMQL